MVDIVTSQNSFTKSCGKIFHRNSKYNYHEKYRSKTYSLGHYRYCIDGSISMDIVDAALGNDGINSDGKAYYWHYFHNSCCFEDSLNYDLYPDLKKNRFIAHKIKSGKWNFNHNAYACITRAIAELKPNLTKDQSLVVFFPYNKKLNKDVQDKYMTEFIKLLKKDHITYAVGNINKVEENNKQLVIVVIDVFTTIKSKNYIIKEICSKKKEQNPLVLMYSLIVVYDENVGKFSVDLHVYREKEEEKKKIKIKADTSLRLSSSIDEEDLIMRSLAGYGPDPEIFGF